MTGFIKLHRGWRNCDVFHDEPLSEREAWLWLIENAAWKDTARRTGKGAVVPLERGQIHVSLGSLATAWKWTPKRVRGFISRLEQGLMVGTTKGTAGTVLTISNYGKYQDQGHSEGTRKGTVRAQSGHTQEEGKERKEDNITRLTLERPADVSPQVWADFVSLRKAKRAPLTDTALQGINREAVKARWTLDQALTECVARGWAGFKADWVGRDDKEEYPLV